MMDSIFDLELGQRAVDYNEIKLCLAQCPDLAGLDEAAVASLFWRGAKQHLKQGAVVYEEQTELDDTFCLLLSGDLQVEKGGTAIGVLAAQQVFGETAYFTRSRERTATVRVASPEAVVLKIRLTAQELEAPQFAALKQCLGRQAWDRFVDTSQNAVA